MLLIKKKKASAKRFSWTVEKLEDLLSYIKEYKSNCDFKGIDFEADLASMYTEVRKCMSRDYTDDFGPEMVSDPEIDLKDMNKDQYEMFTKKSEAEKVLIKNGYSRIKEKVKAVRQDYRNALNRGTRSGSGRVVQENFSKLYLDDKLVLERFAVERRQCRIDLQLEAQPFQFLFSR